MSYFRMLHEQVELALTRRGFPREREKFSPHLTLARVRPETARDVAGPLAEAVRSVSVPQVGIPVREVSLMLSRLGPAGAVYRRLEAWALE